MTHHHHIPLRPSLAALLATSLALAAPAEARRIGGVDAARNDAPAIGSVRTRDRYRDRWAPNGRQVICVEDERTGSRLRRRTCRTEREWEADGGVPEAR